MLTHEIMSTYIHSIGPEESVGTAARMMRDGEVGCLIVAEDGSPAGIITDRDIVVRCLSEGHDVEVCRVHRHMTSPVISASPESDMLDTAHIMTERDIRRVPVVDGDKAVGLVSLSDIAQAMDKAVLQMDRAVHDLLQGMGASRA